METSPLFRRRKPSSASGSSLGTNMSMSGSGTAHEDVGQLADDLQRFTQQYESISEVLHNMVRLEQKKMEPLPNVVYCDKTCSMMDLLLRIRRDVILDVLSQVGRNFTNIANFLRDQVDITRWGQFDALASLKTLPTTVTSLANTASQGSSVVPASSIPTAKPMETSPRARARARAATTPSSSQDSAQKFQLELPGSHRSLRKKHAVSNLRPVEAVHRGMPSGSSNARASPAPSPRREGDTEDQPGEPDSDHHHHHHRSTAGKAKSALVHLFTKNKSGNSSIPLSHLQADDRPGTSPPATATDEASS